MIIRKAYKFKLKTNSDIDNKLSTFGGHSRFIWNKFLSLNLERLTNKQNMLWYDESSFWLTLLKKSDEYAFLREAPSQILQQKLKDLTKAFKDGFDKKQPLKRIPKFKKKGFDSFRFPIAPKVKNRHIFIPKIGWIRFFKSQNIQGTLKNFTISQSSGGWFVSIQVEIEQEELKHESDKRIGIDLGITEFASLSNGEQYSPVNAFKKSKERLAKYQRSLSKKQKFSSNWHKAKNKITKLHQKVAYIRNDFQHQLSHNITKKYGVIFVEDLKLLNMSKSAKGTIENPGENVKAKSGFNRSLLDQGLSEFLRKLEYKINWRGGFLGRVHPRYTSQTCNSCQYRSSENRKSQAKFQCIQCNHKDNADINAAKNILDKGLNQYFSPKIKNSKAVGQTVLVCGSVTLETTMKQKPKRRKSMESPCFS